MTERPNIRRLQILEKGDPALPFDPDKDITERDWQAIRERFEHVSEIPHLAHTSAIMAVPSLFLILQPDAVLKTSVTNEIRRKSEIAARRSLWLTMSEQVLPTGEVRNILRESFKDEQVSISDRLQELRLGEKYMEYAQLARLAKILFPESDFHVESGKNMLLRALRSAELAGNGRVYGRLAVCQKILYGEFSTSQRGWKIMWDELAEMRKEVLRPRSNTNVAPVASGMTDYFMEILANMKILAAKDVRVGEHGLEIMMGDKDADPDRSTVPESLQL